MKKEEFTIEFTEDKICGDYISEDKNINWLFLHGAGKSDRKRFEKIRKLFSSSDISSCAFDFVGHGESTGNILGSSLEHRTQQAAAVINSLKIHEPLSIIAASMSGYTAIKLIEFYEINNMVLLAPGIYTAQVYSTVFGSEFSRIIREANSWQNSDAWKILKTYRGNLVIFAAENDQVIPRELIEKIYKSAEQAKSKKIVLIKEATHPLGEWLEKHPADLQLVFNEIFKVKE
jgi:esterase/lipase